MKTVSLKLPEALETKLTVIARRRGVSKSAVVREALEHLPPTDEPSGDSLLARAEDLAGSIQGPSDLSHGDRHLRDYGR